MIFAEHLVVIRGGGDLATGVAYRLHKAGFPLIVLELQQPMVVRRAVALATAVSNGTVDVEDLRGVRVDDVPRAEELASTGVVSVLVQPQLEPVLAALSAPPAVVVDARMAKRNLDTARDQAPLVIALGPGFNAGVDCDAVVETMRGHKLGRVFWRGAAEADTGTPGIVAGKGRERVLRAPATGTVAWARRIGDVVSGNEQLGAVAEQPVLAPFDGVVRGLIAPGTSVREGQKIGDVDARADPAACYLISDKALAIGGGVLEAVLTWLNQTDA